MKILPPVNATMANTGNISVTDGNAPPSDMAKSELEKMYGITPCHKCEIAKIKLAGTLNFHIPFIGPRGSETNR